MILKQYMVLGVIEQAIMFGIIFPATGSWVCHIYKTMIETLIMIEIVIFVIATLNQ